MPVTVPTRTAGSLGTTKSDLIPLSNEPQQVSAAQYNQCADSLIDAINLANANEAAIGGVNYKPLTGSEANAILAVNCNGNMTDLAGDAVFDAGVPLFVANGSYDGLRSVVQMSTGGNSVATTTATDHQIPIASPVTYGGMFYMDLTQASSPYMMVSGTTIGAPNQNYGLRMNTDQFQTTPGGDGFSRFVPRECWFHGMIVEDANRVNATLYVNGKFAQTLATSDPGAVLGTNDLWIGQLAGTANNSAAGLASDLFIADAEYSAAQVRTLAENAFGHPLP